jgi:hypothetical protein
VGSPPPHLPHPRWTGWVKGGSRGIPTLPLPNPFGKAPHPPPCRGGQEAGTGVRPHLPHHSLTSPPHPHRGLTGAVGEGRLPPWGWGGAYWGWLGVIGQCPIHPSPSPRLGYTVSGGRPHLPHLILGFILLPTPYYPTPILTPHPLTYPPSPASSPFQGVGGFMRWGFTGGSQGLRR